MKLYKKLAATLCLLVSTTSFCSGMQSFYDLGNENWSLYENNPKSQAANDGIKNALIYWNLSCSQQEPDCEEAQKKLGFLYNHQDSHVRFIVGVYNWEQYAIKEGEEKKEFLESALNHLVFSSNLNHPEAQKQIQTIKSQNDSVYQLPLSQIYYNQGNFDEGFSFLCTLLKAGNEEARSRMIEIFDKSPEAVKHFHQSIGKLEAEFVHNNPGSRCGDLIQAILPFSRPFLGALLDVKPDLAEQLDDHTQKNIGARYANALHGLEKGDLQKRYADQAMRYNILSAKQGNKDAQNDLLIRIMIINTNGQEIFYKHLLPLLEAGDEQAQNLFNQFCLQEINDYRTRSIYDYFSSIASQLFKDKSNPGLLKVLDHVIQSYESFRSQKNGGTLSLLNLSNVALSPADTEYQAAMELLKESPHDALGRLREAEKLGSEEAKAKLAEIRNSQGYKVPHKAEENDPSHLLKKDDETESLRLFNHFDTHFSKRIKKHEFSQKEIGEAAFILYQAAELGNLAAKTEVKRLKKSQGYKDAQKRPGSTSTDPYYRLARNFYGLEGVQAHLKGEVNNSSSAQGGGAQKSPETPSVQRRGKKGGRRNRKTASQSLSAQKGGRDAHNNTTSSSTSTNLQRKTKQGSTTTPTTTTSATQKERTPEDILNLAQQCLYKNNIEEAKQYLNDAVPSVSAEAEEPNTTTSQKSSKPKSFSSPSNGESIRDEDEKEKKHKKTLPRKTYKTNEFTAQPVRRNSETNLLNNSQDNRQYKQELTRTRSVMNLSLPPYGGEVKDTEEKSDKKNKDKHHSRKISFRNWNPWKDKEKNSGKQSSQSLTTTVTTTREGNFTTPGEERSRSRRSSISSESHETSGKEHQKLKRSSSRSSFSASEESSVEGEMPADSLINLTILPEKATDYYPRHNRILQIIFSQKFGLSLEDQETLRVILTRGERPFQITLNDIKKLFLKFEGFTKGIKRGGGGHEAIRGFGLTLNPNANGIKESSYYGQIEQAKEKIVRIIARTLTEGDYKRVQ